MKKFFSLLGISLLALVLAVPAFAADKPIQVYINGSSLTFTAGTPYLKDNTVLVPFRVIFEKLGLQVLWDSKTGTVTGTGADLNISLKVGSKRASVNGTVKQLTVAPVSKAGTTYIPLRFIAEATGGTAVWEPASRSVKITVSQSSSSDEKEITALIHLANQYYNEEKAISFYSLVDSGSESDSVESLADMNTMFELYDLKQTIESLKILSIAGNEATVYTVENSVRTGGLYIPDEQFEYLYSMVRIGGSWKISGMEIQESTVLLTREQGLKQAVLPPADAAVLKDNVSKYYQNMNARNVEGASALLTSYGEEYDADSRAELQEIFDSYDLSYSLTTANPFYYAEGEAAVYAEVSIKDGDTGENYTQSLIFIFTKSDSGTWTIDDIYHVGFESLQS